MQIGWDHNFRGWDEFVRYFADGEARYAGFCDFFYLHDFA